MKKAKKIVVFILFTSLAILAACEKKPSYAVDNVYHGESDSQYSWYTGVNAGARYAEGPDGFFYLNSDKFLFFIRPDTEEYVYVCAKPDCNHRDSNCNAYVEAPAIHYHDGKIYFFQQTSKWDGQTVTLENGIYKMDINGTNRKKNCIFAG